MNLGHGCGERLSPIGRHSVTIVVLGSLFLTGCVSSGTSPTAIEIKDGDVVIPSVRIAWQTSRSVEPAVEPSSVRDGLAVELDLAAGQGRDSQNLAAGQEPIQFNSTTFFGPQTIEQRFDFLFASLAARFRAFPGGGPVGLEWLIGGGYSTLDLRLEGNQQVKDDLSSVGFTAGLGILWRAGKRTTLQARLTALATLDEPSQVSAIELVVTQALARHVKFRGGYARWEIEADSGSDIEVEFSGPVLGLELDF